MEKKKPDLRTRIYEIIDETREGDRISYIYDYVMMFFVFIGLVPLAFHADLLIFTVIDRTTAAVFCLDYILRLITADKKMNGQVLDFFLYPFTPMAIIDLISILPSFTPLTGSFKLLRLVRMLRTVRVLRVFKMFRYSKNLIHLINVFRRESVALISIFSFVIVYILIIALIAFNIEPQTFDSFFDAVYWAVISLTTIGYGDLYLITDVGRLITMLTSLVGVLIIALPTGIITAGIMMELEDSREEREETAKRIQKLKQPFVNDDNRDELLEQALEELDELKQRESELEKREGELEKREGELERQESNPERRESKPES